MADYCKTEFMAIIDVLWKGSVQNKGVREYFSATACTVDIHILFRSLFFILLL
jgi:hypothetical protein